MKKAWLLTIPFLLVLLWVCVGPRRYLAANESVELSNSTTSILFADTFSDGNLDGWTIVDAPGADSAPSNWRVVEAKNRVVLLQSSNINTPDLPYEGTYVYAGSSEWTDYYMRVIFEPDDNDGIIIIFRRVDDDNYYRLMLDRQRNYRRLEKKVGGVYTTLAEDLTTGYDGTWNHIQISVFGTSIEVEMDHEVIFAVNDASLPRGAIGLGTWANTKAHFDNVIVTTGSADPYANSVVDAHIKIDGNGSADTWEILGLPELHGDNDFLSIGGPSYWIVLDMGENEEIVDGPGNDLRVYEVGSIFGGFDEEYNVSVGNSPTGPWHFVGQGWTTSVFDLAASSVSSARYVRIDDLSSRTDGYSTPGSDIDGLQALNMPGVTPIDPPNGFSINPIGTDVNLSWNMVEEAVAYNVYASNRGNYTGYSLMDSVPAETTTYLHANAAYRDLHYVVSAIDVQGVESDFSAEVPYLYFIPLVVRQ